MKPTAASQEKAKKMYNVDCAVCHNQNGDGKTDLAKRHVVDHARLD